MKPNVLIQNWGTSSSDKYTMKYAVCQFTHFINMCELYDRSLNLSLKSFYS